MFSYILLFNLIFATLTSEAKKFPDDFLFGTSTSAYQIEGAWNVDGKGPSIWDEYTHLHPEMIADHQNGDIATNSYKFFMDDVTAAQDLKLNFYRFSIGWSRILPNGDLSVINEKGIAYYNELIDNLLAVNIEPMVTMYHWDLPLSLRSLNGAFTNWAIIDQFKVYANLLFERFGDRVKYWITFNEPLVFCLDGGAAGVKINGVNEYLCGHNVLKAHATVYHLYKESFYECFKGQVGISLNSFFWYSKTNDSYTVDRAMQFSLGWFAAPIFGKDGNYPSLMIEQIAQNSKLEGLSQSRLPVFSSSWRRKLRGPADFLGMNYYTSRYVELLNVTQVSNPTYTTDMGINTTIHPEWKQAAISWLYSVPQGLGDCLRWVSKEYNRPAVFITENGWSDYGELEDNGRIEYLRDHLEVVLDVVSKNECLLKGYSVWSLVDNFEWSSGYTVKFGLNWVNMTSPRSERIPKKSTKFMQRVITTRKIPNTD